MQFSIEDYMDPGEVKSRANCADFSSYIAVLRSAHSHRPITGYKGVHQRGPDGKYEARNSPFPVRAAAAPPRPRTAPLALCCVPVSAFTACDRRLGACGA